MDRQVFICEDTMEGIFTAVYDGWASRSGHSNVVIRCRESENMELFCRYIHVPTDREKAAKVIRTIKGKLGQDTFEQISYAACSVDEEKGTAIYQTLVEGLSRGNNKRVLENLSNPYIRRVTRLQLKVWHELHRYMGFVRFRELENGVLFSAITPENAILPLLESHFADRFPRENWMIYDEKRKQALIHPAGKAAWLYHHLELEEEFSRGGEEYEALWKCFCTNIAIKERCRPVLQRQNLPLKFRDKMIEFK